MKIIKLILNKLRGIVHSTMEDPQKVQAKLIELQTKTGHVWTTSDGYHALTSVSFNTSGAVFNPSKGVVVKVFLDTYTKEIKLFPFGMFER